MRSVLGNCVEPDGGLREEAREGRGGSLGDDGGTMGVGVGSWSFEKWSFGADEGEVRVG